MTDKTTIMMTGVLNNAKRELQRFAEVIGIALPRELDALEAINDFDDPADDALIVVQAMVRAAIAAMRKCHEDRGITHG